MMDERMNERQGRRGWDDGGLMCNNRKISFCLFFVWNRLSAKSFRPQPKEIIFQFIRKNFAWVYMGGRDSFSVHRK